MAKLIFRTGAAVAPFMEAVLSARDNAADGGADSAPRVEPLCALRDALDEACQAFQQGRGEPFPDGFEAHIENRLVAEARRVIEQAENDAHDHGFRDGTGVGLTRERIEAELDERGAAADDEWRELLAECVLPGEVVIDIDPVSLAFDAFHEAVRFMQDALGVKTGDAAALFFDGPCDSSPEERIQRIFAGYARFERLQAS